MSRPRLAKAGADVAVTDIREELGSTTVEEIRSFGRDSFLLVADVSRKAQVDALFDAATATGFYASLQERFVSAVRVASIGEVTSRALERHQVRPHVVPDQPRMGAMVKALCTIPFS